MTPTNSIFVSRLAALEVAATLTRLARGNERAETDVALAVDQLRHAFAHEFNVIELTPLLVSHALNHIRNYALKASDALQLAAATELQRKRRLAGFDKLIFVSADSELNSAEAEGLLVEDPNLH